MFIDNYKTSEIDEEVAQSYDTRNKIAKPGCSTESSQYVPSLRKPHRMEGMFSLIN